MTNIKMKVQNDVMAETLPDRPKAHKRLGSGGIAFKQKVKRSKKNL